MNKIYIVNGYPESGKDLFVTNVDYMMGTDVHVENISSVDQVKKAAMLLGWNQEKTEKSRNALSDLKDLSTKAWKGPLMYMKKVIYETYARKESFVIFIHIREPKEISVMVKEFPQTKTIFIKRHDSKQDINNHADQYVENYDYDYTIDNTGTVDQFEYNTKQFIDGVIRC